LFWSSATPECPDCCHGCCRRRQTFKLIIGNDELVFSFNLKAFHSVFSPIPLHIITILYKCHLHSLNTLKIHEKHRKYYQLKGGGPTTIPPSSDPPIACQSCEVSLCMPHNHPCSPPPVHPLPAGLAVVSRHIQPPATAACCVRRSPGRFGCRCCSGRFYTCFPCL
jgi:hypothetical protein